MTLKKKQIIIISCIAVSVLTVILCVFFLMRRSSSSDSENPVYVNSVAAITGMDTGVASRFSGVVEPQQTIKIQKATDRTVQEIYVKAGDTVKKGDELFSYDTEETQLKLSEAQLELERLSGDITSLNNQIKYLENEKAQAPSSEAFSYTTQILTAQNDVKRAEYNKKSKEMEIEQIKKNLENATVTSEIDGIIKSVNDGTSTEVIYGMESDNAFITILSSNAYRIKGKINEQNMAMLSVGQPVIIHSRTDENATWQGSVSEIDMDNPVSSSNMYASSDTSSQSSSYYFYVELAEGTGSDLMLGQHVFMEPDMGQNNRKEGLWLSSAYLVTEGNDAYVWVSDDKDKLEKRKVSTGEYDADLDEYEITDGLTAEDYIAFPDASYEEGMPCTKNADVFMYDTPSGEAGEVLSDKNVMGEEALPEEEGTGDDGMAPEDAASQEVVE